MALHSRTYLYLILLGALLSCNPFSKRKDKSSIVYEVVERSVDFKEEAFDLRIDSTRDYLYLTLDIDHNKLWKTPFPKSGNEELTGTSFVFKLTCDGKEITSPELKHSCGDHGYFGYNKWLKDEFKLESDTINLRTPNSVGFKIPFYLFHNIKAGRHDFEITCFQNMFCSPYKNYKELVNELGDTVQIDFRNRVKATLFSFKAKFKLNVPPIFKTIIYGYGIELRNDSVYSPAGMDNTIWNSSYPDVYWTIHFPGNDQYCSSDYKKSTAFYDLQDTFYLYHYTPYDSVSIGVWDHDNLSRDDYISYLPLSLKQFPNNKRMKFGYENLKSIEIKFDRQGYVNKQ